MKIKLQPDQTFEFYLGRFQPLTIAHEQIVNEILLNGNIPLIGLGSCNRKDHNNPFTVEERIGFFEKVFDTSNFIFIESNDNPDWDIWFNELIIRIKEELTETYEEIPDFWSKVTIVVNNKEEDRISEFKCNGKVYHDEFYTKVFEDFHLKVRNVDHIVRIGTSNDISARHVRTDLEKNKYMLDYRVYQYIKEKYD
jgi:nicotinamide mononucleotide adenylyltransferase